MSDTFSRANTMQLVKSAIVYAFLFDIGVTFLLGLVFRIIYIAYITGGTFVYSNDIWQEYANNPLFAITIFFWGSIVSVMAGYLCAQIAEHRIYTHAAWAASISFFIGIAFQISRFTVILTKTTVVNFKEMFDIFSLPLLFALYLMGAYIYHLNHSRI